MGQIPDKVYVNLKYSDRYTLQGELGVKAVQRWSLNSLHDPDLTGTGHQPLYYDQLVNSLEGNGLYHRYRVHAVSYRITVLNTDSNVEQIAVLVPTTHGNVIDTLDDIDALCEAPYAKKAILSVNTSGKNQHTFVGSISIKKLEGKRDLDNNIYSAVYGSSPAYQPQLSLITGPMNEGNASHNTIVSVVIQYKAELYDRIYRSSVN